MDEHQKIKEIEEIQAVCREVVSNLLESIKVLDDKLADLREKKLDILNPTRKDEE